MRNPSFVEISLLASYIGRDINPTGMSQIFKQF
jgi:hypothetical protein